VRLAGSLTDRHGTIFNVTSGLKVNSQDNLGLRGQILWKPSNGVEFTLAGDYSHQNPTCCTQIYVRVGATQRPLNRQYAALAAAQEFAVPSTNPFDRVTDVDTPLRARNDIGGVSLRAKIDTGIGTVTSGHRVALLDWDPRTTATSSACRSPRSRTTRRIRTSIRRNCVSRARPASWATRWARSVSTRRSPHRVFSSRALPPAAG
jgi:hypothetical protein